MKNLTTILKLILIACLLAACQGKDKAKDEIKVGVISGPETQLMEIAKKVAKEKYNLNLKIVEFSDYSLPNIALNDGSIDANMFQHQPYLDSAIKAHGYKIVSIAKTFVYPMAAYSKRWKLLKEIPHMGTIAIPNDPSNEGRALLLAQDAGIITLDPKSGLNATPVDIVKNRQQLHFKEIDAAQLPRVLDDVDAAFINTNFAVPAGLMPKRDGLLVEGPNSPYANIIVVRVSEKDMPKFQQLVATLHSPEVLAEAQRLFQGQAVPAW